MCFGWYDNKRCRRYNPANFAPVVLTFEITDKKLHVPVITLSKENDIKLLEQLKTGFKRTIKWNKYRSQMSIQPQNNNLTETFFHIIMYQTLK